MSRYFVMLYCISLLGIQPAQWTLRYKSVLLDMKYKSLTSQNCKFLHRKWWASQNQECTCNQQDIQSISIALGHYNNHPHIRWMKVILQHNNGQSDTIQKLMNLQCKSTLLGI